MKAEILYGFHPVYEALRAGRRTFHEIYISKQTSNKRIYQIRSAAARQHLPIKEVSAAKLQSHAGDVSHQGIAAKVTAYPLVDANGLLPAAECGNVRRFFCYSTILWIHIIWVRLSEPLYAPASMP